MTCTIWVYKTSKKQKQTEPKPKIKWNWYIKRVSCFYVFACLSCIFKTVFLCVVLAVLELPGCNFYMALLKLACLCLPRARIKGVHHHCRAWFVLKSWCQVKLASNYIRTSRVGQDLKVLNASAMIPLQQLWGDLPARVTGWNLGWDAVMSFPGIQLPCSSSVSCHRHLLLSRVITVFESQ